MGTCTFNQSILNLVRDDVFIHVAKLHFNIEIPQNLGLFTARICSILFGSFIKSMDVL